MARETEDFVGLYVLRRHIVEGKHVVVLGRCAHKHSGECRLLLVDFFEHQAQLFAVFGVELGLPFDEQIAIFAKVINLLRC